MINDGGTSETDAERIERLEREAEDLARELGQMRTSRDSRDVIGMAKGLIMASLHCTPDEAFEVLVQQSQAERRKLHDIAQDIVDGSQQSHHPPPS